MPKGLRVLLRAELLLLAAAVALASWTQAEQAVAPYIRLTPVTVALAGLVIAWQLRRSRLVLALVVLGLGFLLITRSRAGDPWILQIAAVLVPINLAVIAVLPERGTFTEPGLWHWGAILAQAGAVTLIVATGRVGATHATLGFTFFRPPHRVADWVPLGQPALVTFVAATGVTAASRWFAPGTTGAGYLSALVATFLAFQAGDPLSRTLYLSTAGAVLVTAAIERSYLLAYHDALTGLRGRRALNEELERLSGGYTIAMVDVDHFKRFNDTYGHDVGDQVLRSVGFRLARALVDGEVFRYGGEEFAVLFSGKSLDSCTPLLEGAREAIAREPFTIRSLLRPRKKPRKRRWRAGKQRETITVSIGAAEAGNRHQQADQVIRAADQALYRAKEGGRNRVCT